MNAFEKLQRGLTSYHANINWFAFCLVVIYSWGSWLEILGVWAELPLMVKDLPEGWRLPSIIVMFIQLGQLGSLSYLFIKLYFPNLVSFRLIISAKLVITLISTIMMSFFWNSTLYIFGEYRSFGLFLLMFLISLVNGTTSLAAMPFIAETFKKEYLIPYYIGETLMTVIPSVVAIVQGAGEDKGCRNATRSITSMLNSSTHDETDTVLEPIPLSPIFSVAIYFVIIFGFLLMSAISFVLLNSKYVKSARKAQFIERTTIVEEKDYETTLLEKSPGKIETTKTSNDTTSKDKLEIYYLYAMSFMITFVMWGSLSGLQSYSTLPYGNDVFHMSINLASIFLPIMIFAAVWSPSVTLKQIGIEFGVGSLFAIYIIMLSIQSPCPILLKSFFGPLFTILSWFFAQGFFWRARYFVALRLERFGERILLIACAYSIIGEVIGGVIMYLLVEKLRVFVDKPECVFDKDVFCPNY